jgi:hypothetical protein
MWTKPTITELPTAEGRIVRAHLRAQAFDDRECWACLRPLRYPTSTYCSHACREEMQDDGMVDGGALVIVLHQLIPVPTAAVPTAAEVLHHAAA